jgi:GAF domain-containing protein
VTFEPEQAVMSQRGAQAGAAFVELVDALVDDFDVIDMLTLLSRRCVELLDVAASGILLADSSGTLRVVGASNEQAQLLEVLQIQHGEGPCWDCYHTGDVIISADMAAGSRWPRFAPVAVAAGYPSVCAVPMRLKQNRIGCLNLFMSKPVRLPDPDIALAQALADVATIAIVQDEANSAADVRERQLQHALNSRIVIEQAKGMIAAQADVDMHDAFTRLRAHARNNNLRLTDVAAAIISGSIKMGPL